MKTAVRRAMIIVSAFVIAFMSMPAMGGTIDANAAAVKPPAQVRNLRAGKVTQTSVRLTWKKTPKNRNTKGYAVFRNGKLIKRVGMKRNTFVDTGLKAGTRYTYTVRAYNKNKQKQYYNSRTEEWQVIKPPANQWKGKKTRKVNRYKYGKASAIKKVTTKKPGGRTDNRSGNKTGGNQSGPSDGADTGEKAVDTNLKGLTSGIIRIQGDNPTVSVSYNPKGGEVRWTSSNTNAVRIKSVSNRNGISTATLEGGTSYKDGVIVRAAYKGKLSGARYIGNTEYTFSVSNVKVVRCTNLKLENRLPIYDHSYPQFRGIPAESVRKVLDFDAARDVERAFISCDLSEDPKELNVPVTFYNKTTGTELRGPSMGPMFGEPLRTGFDVTRPADVLSPKDVHVRGFGFATRVNGRRWLFAVEFEPGTLVAGNNVIEISIDGKAAGTITVKAKSRAAAYTEFARKITDAASPRYYSPEDGKCTGNVTLLRKLRGIEKYINENYEYPACVRTSLGGAAVVTVGGYGRQIDSGIGGCEDGAIMMSICAMYNGADAGYKYVGSHCICVIPDSTQLFGFEKSFDATPKSGAYTNASDDSMVEYLNSIPKIIY